MGGNFRFSQQFLQYRAWEVRCKTCCCQHCQLNDFMSVRPSLERGLSSVGFCHHNESNRRNVSQEKGGIKQDGFTFIWCHPKRANLLSHTATNTESDAKVNRRMLCSSREQNFSQHLYSQVKKWPLDTRLYMPFTCWINLPQTKWEMEN